MKLIIPTSQNRMREKQGQDSDGHTNPTGPYKLWKRFGITESLRLEMTSKIVKPNRQPNTTMPAKPRPKVPHPHVFSALQGW